MLNQSLLPVFLLILSSCTGHWVADISKIESQSSSYELAQDTEVHTDRIVNTQCIAPDQKYENPILRIAGAGYSKEKKQRLKAGTPIKIKQLVLTSQNRTESAFEPDDTMFDTCFDQENLSTYTEYILYARVKAAGLAQDAWVAFFTQDPRKGYTALKYGDTTALTFVIRDKKKKQALQYTLPSWVWEDKSIRTPCKISL